MRLEITPVIRQALLKKGVKNPVIEDGSEYRNELIEHNDLTASELGILRSVCEGSTDRPTRSLLRKLKLLENIKTDAPIASLEVLTEALRQLIRERTENSWIFYEPDESPEPLPYLIEYIEYHPPERSDRMYHPAYISARAVAINRGKHTSVQINLRKDRLPAGGLSANAVLLSFGWMLESPELIKAYHDQMSTYKGFRQQVGEQLTGRGTALTASDDSYWHRQLARIQLDRDGVAGRLIIDDEEEWGKDEVATALNTTFAKPGRRGTKHIVQDDEGTEQSYVSVRYPEHPTIRCFHLRLHEFVTTHVGNVEAYVYDRKAFDKVVIPDSTKELIDALVLSKKEGDDIISGKGKGTIFLSSGPPGTGKTLTAEAYAERAKKPLYSIQCAQLGVEPEKIEDRLGEFLRNCNRWGAIGLIDEADVFIRERSNDFTQNAVVGVFLRLLEYFTGVLFLTTNREQAVDDAILSRCIAHVHYQLPTRAEAALIWQIMFQQYKVPHPAIGALGRLGLEEKPKPEFFQDLAERYKGCSGRNIKHAVRLGLTLAGQRGVPLSTDILDWVMGFLDIDKKK